jgi:hypothetical protein
MRASTLQIGTQAMAVLGPGNVGAIVQADAANTADIYLGGQYVTADATGTGGVRLPAGTALPVRLRGADILYAIAPSGSQAIRVLQGERT